MRLGLAWKPDPQTVLALRARTSLRVSAEITNFSPDISHALQMRIGALLCTLHMRVVARLTTGPRKPVEREIKRARSEARKSDHIVHRLARNELDTRADTICAGANFRLLSTTGQCCEVKGFHDDFAPIQDVPVARVATAWKDRDGATQILVVNEALYFGSEMDHSLINPNQIRHFGVVVNDNPYDPASELGIDHDACFVSFETKGSTVFFESYVPSDKELETCPHVVLTDGDTEWDPNSIQMSQN